LRITLARRLAVATLALSALAVAARSAEAQALPGGSYQQSCTQAHWAGTTLAAECRAADGKMRGTGLPNANRCVGDIGNNNGQLQCNYAPGTPAAPASPPRGPAPAPGNQPGYSAPGYNPPPGPPPGPGYGQPGYGYEPRRAQCEELWRRTQDLRAQLQYAPWGPDRERLEYRLNETRDDRDRLGCRG
jgi:hypothetical protein